MLQQHDRAFLQATCQAPTTAAHAATTSLPSTPQEAAVPDPHLSLSARVSQPLPTHPDQVQAGTAKQTSSTIQPKELSEPAAGRRKIKRRKTKKPEA